MGEGDASNAHKDFFISYTSVDRIWAEWIAWQLEEAGYSTIIQAWDFQTGGNFVLDMDKATKVAERTIAVLSPDYFTSMYTSSEWAVAFRHDPKSERGLLLPVRVRPCDIEGLLRQIVYIDLIGQDEQAARTTLLAGIGQQRKKPTGPPAFPVVPSVLPDRPAFPGAFPAIWNIPYPRNPYFIGREVLLTRLATTLRIEQTTTLTQPQAISGLGGIGKTQVAVEYAYRYHQDYQAVLWALADTRESLISAFVTIAKLLNLPEQDEQNQMVIVAAVKHWFATQTKWLLILDNADDLALVHEFFPPVYPGHILLTTRAYTMGRLAQRIEVDTLNPELGALFLLRRADLLAPDALLEQGSVTDIATARELVQEMGGLPLALDQAAAYIEEVGCSLEDYKKLYQTRRSVLLNRRGGLIADHREPVATTWSLSFSTVEQKNPAAADLLRLCAFLHPDSIPEELITEGTVYLGPELSSAPGGIGYRAPEQTAFKTDLFVLNEAIATLHAYSLIQRNEADKTLSMHRLVQAVLKDGMNAQTQQTWAERAVQVVSEAFPYVEPNAWSQCERLLSHAQQCAILIDEKDILLPEATHLLNEAGISMSYRARYAETLPLLQRALAIREQQFDYAAIVTSLGNLASVYQELGQYEQALPLYQRALDLCEQELGPDHPGTALVLNNLAGLYKELGQYEQALPLYQRALAIRERRLGPDHPDTAESLNGLARLYQERGEYEQALPFYQRALDIHKQQLGPTHPSTLTIRKNYMSLLQAMGHEDEAE